MAQDKYGNGEIDFDEFAQIMANFNLESGKSNYPAFVKNRNTLIPPLLLISL